jgi:hypothetical protein
MADEDVWIIADLSMIAKMEIDVPKLSVDILDMNGTQVEMLVLVLGEATRSGCVVTVQSWTNFRCMIVEVGIPFRFDNALTRKEVQQRSAYRLLRILRMTTISTSTNEKDFRFRGRFE